MNLSPEERMEMMLTVFERVYGQAAEPQDLDALLPLAELRAEPAPEPPLLPGAPAALAPATIIDSRLRNPAPTVQELIERIQPLPELSAVMGICPDGLPLLFDLADPYPGSMLLASSHPGDFTDLFQALLVSAACLNSTQQVRFTVICEEPRRYQVAGGEPHCMGVYANRERAALEHIFACTEVAEQRRTGRELGAIHLLVIDNLPALLRSRNYDLEINLKWLARNGARSGFWLLAGADSRQERSLPAGLVAEFKTMIFGRLDHEQRFRKINPAPRQALELSAGEYVTRLGGHWVQFSPLEVY